MYLRKLLLLLLLATSCTPRITDSREDIGVVEKVEPCNAIGFCFHTDINMSSESLESSYGLHHSCPGTRRVLVKRWRITWHYENEPLQHHIRYEDEIVRQLEVCQV